MGKIGRLLAGAAVKPIVDQMKKERKLELKHQNSLLNQASMDVLVEKAEELKPRIREVKQPFDSIIHYHEFW